MKHLKKYALGVLLVASVSVLTFMSIQASDHDDGEMELKGRNLNLTDLYVFKENWQNPAADPDNLILIMNTNPRSLARQQYFFSATARYEFHLSRLVASAESSRPRGDDDVTLRFEFGAPDSNMRQAIKLTSIKDGVTVSANAGMTTTLADVGANTLNQATVNMNGKNLTVFAGLREDPFFFDVESFFRVRGALAASDGTSIAPGFKSPATALDFTSGYNVNSIVLRVPISFLQSASRETVFDVWETISVPE